MIVQISIKHLSSNQTIRGIEKLEEDEYRDFVGLMAKVSQGKVSYLKIVGDKGEDIFISRKILIDSIITISKIHG